MQSRSVMICENFALEKLGRLNSQKFSPSKITHYTVYNLLHNYSELQSNKSLISP